MGVFELDRRPWCSTGSWSWASPACFTALAVRAFGRRQADAIGTHPPAAAGAVWRAAAAPRPLRRWCRWSPASLLWSRCDDGFQGEAIEKKARDYWKQNLATWKDAPQPAIADVDLDLTLEPGAALAPQPRHLRAGQRPATPPLARFALTGGPHWEKVRWTLDGKPYKPEDRSGLYVFTPPAPLPPGGRRPGRLRVRGASSPRGSQERRRHQEFILPSGVVLTSFTPELRAGARLHGGDRHRRRTRTTTSPGSTPTTTTRGRPTPPSAPAARSPPASPITGPADFTFNSVGSADERHGRRTGSGRWSGRATSRCASSTSSAGAGRCGAGRARRSTTTPATPTTSTR